MTRDSILFVVQHEVVIVKDNGGVLAVCVAPPDDGADLASVINPVVVAIGVEVKIYEVRVEIDNGVAEDNVAAANGLRIDGFGVLHLESVVNAGTGIEDENTG